MDPLETRETNVDQRCTQPTVVKPIPSRPTAGASPLRDLRRSSAGHEVPVSPTLRTEGPPCTSPRRVELSMGLALGLLTMLAAALVALLAVI